jgi:hypothetical protein
MRTRRHGRDFPTRTVVKVHHAAQFTDIESKGVEPIHQPHQRGLVRNPSPEHCADRLSGREDFPQLGAELSEDGVAQLTDDLDLVHSLVIGATSAFRDL